MSSSTPLTTPDGRYIVVRGRLWRCTNPELPEAERQHWVQRLMQARRSVAQAKRKRDAELEREARDQVDEAKRALGERGPVWWQDGAPDYTQYKVANTPYADWYAAL
ncbi:MULTISPECIES: hypothetical protein [Halomonadaceae]|uniref:hypothetical protein n=1 Tax=Halomonadaceae TaxID=28256 RepID=UPI0015826374|nr:MULTISPECIES: hypothetical protein [Halomonas]MDI4638701.1 hypothetical protein [Halomonas sp. BMC7]NUJ59686.1 hypothetical protein [Halomonas taeanensis]